LSLRRACLIVALLAPAAVPGTRGSAPAADEAPAPVPIADVLARPATERDGGFRVRVEGVVTLVHPRADVAVIQDGTGGLWLTLGKLRAAEGGPGLIRPGAEGRGFIVEGRLLRGGYSPALQVERVEPIPADGIPEPIVADFERLFMGADNGILVVCEGIVQACSRAANHVRLVMACQSRRLSVYMLAPAGLPEPDQLLDARVRVVGVVGSVRNTRGEFLAPQLVCSRPEDFGVIAPPPSSPFEAPRVPLAELGRYQFAPVSARRIVTEGIVTFAGHRLLFVQQGLRGVRVRTADPVGVAVGDRVRLAGFIDKGRRIAGINGALVERIEPAAAPEPVAITPDEVARINNEAIDRYTMADPSDCDGCLVRFPATVIETTVADAGGELMLSAGESTVAARLDGPGFAGLAELLPGSRVQVTGVLQIDLLDEGGTLHVTSTPMLRQMAVHLRDSGDVIVLSRPPWWTPRRLGVLLGGSLAVLTGALVWVGLLRREVASQARMLAHEMRRRRDAAVEYEASTRERNRLAANLHDTLLQTLRGIDYQLGACRLYRGRTDAEGADHLEVARRMVNHAADELRDSVWALRTMPLAGRSFAESLEVLGRQLGHGHAEQITVTTEGRPFELPQFVAGNLLLVAQEAIHNALRHAGAGVIRVIASFDGLTDTVTVRITDDGQGFTPGTQAGPDQGHFGIAGMRERVERLGGSVAIASLPGQGTTVTIRVCKREYDPRIDVDADDAASSTVA
jgi:signal transduction histidine kinase